MKNHFTFERTGITHILLFCTGPVSHVCYARSGFHCPFFAPWEWFCGCILERVILLGCSTSHCLSVWYPQWLLRWCNSHCFHIHLPCVLLFVAIWTSSLTSTAMFENKRSDCAHYTWFYVLRNTLMRFQTVKINRVHWTNYFHIVHLSWIVVGEEEVRMRKCGLL